MVNENSTSERLTRLEEFVGVPLSSDEICLANQIQVLREELNEFKEMVDGHMATNDGKFTDLFATAMADVAGTSLGGADGHSKPKIPKLKAFSGSHSSKELENCLWDMEQYFKPAHISVEAQVTIISMYLVEDAKLSWSTRMEDVSAGRVTIATWETLKQELKDQFLPLNMAWVARKNLKVLKQSGSIRDYVKEFSSLLLDIKNMSEEDKLFNFMSRLKPWAQNELRRQAIKDLVTAIAATDGAGNDKKKKGKKKWGDEDPNNEMQHPRQVKKGCYLCGSAHFMRECPKRENINALLVEEAEEQPLVRAGSLRLLNIVQVVEDASSVGALFETERLCGKDNVLVVLGHTANVWVRRLLGDRGTRAVTDLGAQAVSILRGCRPAALTAPGTPANPTTTDIIEPTHNRNQSCVQTHLHTRLVLVMHWFNIISAMFGFAGVAGAVWAAGGCWGLLGAASSGFDMMAGSCGSKVDFAGFQKVLGESMFDAIERRFEEISFRVGMLADRWLSEVERVEFYLELSRRDAGNISLGDDGDHSGLETSVQVMATVAQHGGIGVKVQLRGLDYVTDLVTSIGNTNHSYVVCRSVVADLFMTIGMHHGIEVHLAATWTSRQAAIRIGRQTATQTSRQAGTQIGRQAATQTSHQAVAQVSVLGFAGLLVLSGLLGAAGRQPLGRLTAWTPRMIARGLPTQTSQENKKKNIFQKRACMHTHSRSHKRTLDQAEEEVVVAKKVFEEVLVEEKVEEEALIAIGEP
ncbi:hypothetical protein AgCh_011887 [Apium graveolens]